MQWRILYSMIAWCGAATAASAAAPIELELATERGVQITAPQEWLQLLTSIGIDNVRIRGVRPGDEPRVENRGTSERPQYYIAGILSARNELILPGGRFSRGNRSGLKDYFARLAAEGGPSLTAPRGMFGLAQKQIESTFADLAQPIDFETEDQAPSAVIERLRAKLGLDISLDAAAERTLREAATVPDELRGLTAGTGLAMILRNYGFEMRPETNRGGQVAYRVVAGELAAAAGQPDDAHMPHWPIGWEPQTTPGRAAPSLLEFLNAEIDGYTLEEALAAIAPRLKIPIYLDHAGLAAEGIEPDKIQVRLPRTRTFYKRLIDRILAQARLGCEVRIDEAGRAFLWVSR